MKSAYLLVFASLAICNLPHCKGQSVTEDDPDHRTIDDMILEKAESLLLRSILKKIQGDGSTYGKTLHILAKSELVPIHHKKYKGK